VDAPGINFKAAASKGKFDVEIAKDAAPGPHLVRFFNKDGSSQPRFFIVSTEPELLEKEPNDDFKSPQVIPALPPRSAAGSTNKATWIRSGRVEKRPDADRLVEAYVLASTSMACCASWIPPACSRPSITMATRSILILPGSLRAMGHSSCK